MLRSEIGDLGARRRESGSFVLSAFLIVAYVELLRFFFDFVAGNSLVQPLAWGDHPGSG
jgi:hypothetical protein